MEQRKKFFLLIFTKLQKSFVKISKKFGVMQKPATHRKSDFTVLSFFYGIPLQNPPPQKSRGKLLCREIFDRL
jgi:hypothetical protein